MIRSLVAVPGLDQVLEVSDLKCTRDLNLERAAEKLVMSSFGNTRL